MSYLDMMRCPYTGEDVPAIVTDQTGWAEYWCLACEITHEISAPDPDSDLCHDRQADERAADYFDDMEEH
ncbi:MAG: hypothetical protein QM635_11435 [Microbacteriaceae bacterium]